MTAKLIVSREGDVVTLTMNRPDKKNALDRETYEAMIAALGEAERDGETGAVVLAGAGGAFTAGNDLNDFLSFLDSPKDFPALRFVRALASFQKPLAAAVEGDAIGVGTTMLFHCDLVYAAPGARFKMPFVDLGLVPEAGASLLVPRRFGLAKASQYMLLGESFDAEEALRLGLLTAIAPAKSLMETAQGAARRLTQKPRQALLAARRLMRGDVKEVLTKIDEEAELFAKALADPQTRARFDQFFAARK